MKDEELPPEVKKIMADDDALIPIYGQSREMTQMATIHVGDGTVRHMQMKFIRTRNQNGGVDCKAIMPDSIKLGTKQNQIGG